MKKLLALSAVGLLAFAACGDDDDTPATEAPVATEAAVATDAPADTTAAPADDDSTAPVATPAADDDAAPGTTEG